MNRRARSQSQRTKKFYLAVSFIALFAGVAFAWFSYSVYTAIELGFLKFLFQHCSVAFLLGIGVAGIAKQTVATKAETLTLIGFSIAFMFIFSFFIF